MRNLAYFNFSLTKAALISYLARSNLTLNGVLSRCPVYMRSATRCNWTTSIEVGNVSKARMAASTPVSLGMYVRMVFSTTPRLLSAMA